MNDAPMFFVDKETHEPCPTRGKLLCTLGYTNPDHLHVAKHMVEQQQRADRDMKARLRARLEKANEQQTYGMLWELIDTHPDLLDKALTEAGVS